MTKVQVEGCEEKVAIPIPPAIVSLYSIKEGQVFEVHASEKKKGYLLINMLSKLND